MGLELDALSLTEIIRLQDQLSSILRRRFEQSLALVFSDIVGSTAYFSRFGNEAGRRLQQRHYDLLVQVLLSAEGRLVDTAGDGALVYFPHPDSAAEALIQFQNNVVQDNMQHSREEALVTRIGLHWGTVLTDQSFVTGDAVNVCARVMSSGQEGEIRVTKDAFAELSTDYRLRCRGLSPVTLKGVPDPLELLVLEWRDSGQIPNVVRIEETGESIPLPQQKRISFGRLDSYNGVAANDIVLTLPDAHLTQKISRWHFDLRREPGGLFFFPISTQVTELNGQACSKGDRRQVFHGTILRLSNVMTLHFLAQDLSSTSSDRTISTGSLFLPKS